MKKNLCRVNENKISNEVLNEFLSGKFLIEFCTFWPITLFIETK